MLQDALSLFGSFGSLRVAREFALLAFLLLLLAFGLRGTGFDGFWRLKGDESFTRRQKPHPDPPRQRLELTRSRTDISDALVGVQLIHMMLFKRHSQPSHTTYADRMGINQSVTVFPQIWVNFSLQDNRRSLDMDTQNLDDR